MSDQAQPSHHLHIRIGDAEFTATGTEAVVDKQFQKFLAALPQRILIPTAGAIKEIRLYPDHARPFDPNDPADVGPEVVGSVFQHNGKMIALKKWPNTRTPDADGLLMLLWGYERLENLHGVPAPLLMEAAKGSCIEIERIDRVIAVHRDCYTRSGERKGAKYELTEAGRIYVAQLLRKVCQ